MSLIIVNEAQDINNSHICSFCGQEEKAVIGRAYSYSDYGDHPRKYLFSYCGECGLIIAEKIALLVHPNHKVI